MGTGSTYNLRIYTDSCRKNVNILGGKSIGHCKKKFDMNMQFCVVTETELFASPDFTPLTIT